MLSKCPYCGKDTLGEIEPNSGNQFILAEISLKNKSLESGLPVKVNACVNCKGIVLSGYDITVKQD